MIPKPLRLSVMLGHSLSRCVVAVAMALTLAGPAYSQDKALALIDAIRLAIDLNPSMREYPLRYDSLRALQQTAALRPAINLGVELENVAGSGSFSGTDAAESTLSLFSVVERGGKRAARREIVAQQMSHAELQRQQAVINLAADVAQQFIQVAATQEKLAIKQAALTLQQRIQKDVSKRVEAGAAPDAELLRIKAAVAEHKAELATVSTELAIQRRTLTAFWSLKGDNDFHVAAKLLQLPTALGSINIDELAEGSPQVALLTQQIALQTAVTEGVRAEAASDWGWRVGARHFADTDDTAFSLGLEIPLFSTRRNQGAEVQSQLEGQRIQQQRDVAVWRFKQRLQALNAQLEASNAEVRSLRDTAVPLRQQAFEETQRAYNRGRYSFAELAAEQRGLMVSQQRVLEAATRSHQINIELERLLGQIGSDSAPHSDD